MSGQEGVDYVAAEGMEAVQGTGLVRRKQAGVTDEVGGQNRGEAADPTHSRSPAKRTLMEYRRFESASTQGKRGRPGLERGCGGPAGTGRNPAFPPALAFTLIQDESVHCQRA